MPGRLKKIDNIGPTVSICFDDFPESAVSCGSPLLLDRGFRATYYLCGGLLGENLDNSEICSGESVRTLADMGHEIGCHTYSHLDCGAIGSSKADILKEELEKNSSMIKGLVGYHPCSFAYPYGSLSYASREIVGQRFATARGVLSGVNVGYTDFLNLRANSVYSDMFDLSRIRKILQRTKALSSWTIFYTHDVTSKHGLWGCTPEHFERFLDMLAASGIKVMTMGDVARSILKSSEIRVLECGKNGAKTFGLE